MIVGEDEVVLTGLGLVFVTSPCARVDERTVNASGVEGLKVLLFSTSALVVDDLEVILAA